MYPHELMTELCNKIVSAKTGEKRVLCLYGHCFPGIDQICAQYGAPRIAAAHCYELLLGRSKFRKIVDAEAGSFFVERDLILNFESYCLNPLELHDADMRRFFFANYKQLIYVKQPKDRKLISKVKGLAGFLELSLKIVEADYSELERKISKLI